MSGGYFRAMANAGSFEGFIGADPEPMTNKKGRMQCFLHVGHTPTWKDQQTGDWVRGKPVWVHFAVFGPMAEYVVDNLRCGQRVIVNYELSARYHPRYGHAMSVSATSIRPVAKEFTTSKSEVGATPAELWLPNTAKKRTKWTDEQIGRALGDVQ